MSAKRPAKHGSMFLTSIRPCEEGANMLSEAFYAFGFYSNDVVLRVIRRHASSSPHSDSLTTPRIKPDQRPAMLIKILNPKSGTSRVIWRITIIAWRYNPNLHPVPIGAQRVHNVVVSPGTICTAKFLKCKDPFVAVGR
jgi:hypothetical protein